MLYNRSQSQIFLSCLYYFHLYCYDLVVIELHVKMIQSVLLFNDSHSCHKRNDLTKLFLFFCFFFIYKVNLKKKGGECLVKDYYILSKKDVERAAHRILFFFKRGSYMTRHNIFRFHDNDYSSPPLFFFLTLCQRL